jgi:hypothetical protein
MTEYFLVTATVPKDFMRMCNHYLGEGWSMQGSVALAFDGHISHYAQAFVR